MGSLNISETARSVLAQASNWNFEGDCVILQWMEQISHNLEARAKASTESLQSITKKLAQTQIALENTQNSLNALQYTKYVEMHCQEDEIATETDSVKSEIEEEKPKPDILKVFLQNNLKMLHKCHDKFNFLEDSDEDDVDNAASTENCVYQPRNPYNERLLPHIFGTKLWKENWHIGLCEESAQHYSGDESSDVYSLSSNSSADIESLASHNTAENLSEWTSSVSLNNESSKSSKKIERISNTPNLAVVKTISIPQQYIPTPSERVSLMEKNSNNSIKSPLATEHTTKKTVESKPLNLFDDNDFQSLLSATTKNDNIPTTTTVASQKSLFDDQTIIIDIRQKEIMEKATLEKKKQPIARLNLFDSPTEENNHDFSHVTKKPNLFDELDEPYSYNAKQKLQTDTVQSNAPINIEKKTIINARSLFDDDDDDDNDDDVDDFLNIFGRSKTVANSTLQTKKSILIDRNEEKKEENVKQVSAISSKTLFDDNDDDDNDWISSRNYENSSKERTIKANESLSQQIILPKEDKNILVRKKNLFLDDNNGDNENDLLFSPNVTTEQENVQSKSLIEDNVLNDDFSLFTKISTAAKDDKLTHKATYIIQEQLPPSLRETAHDDYDDDDDDDDDDFLSLFGNSKSKSKSQNELFDNEKAISPPPIIDEQKKKTSLKSVVEIEIQQKISIDEKENAIDKNESQLKGAATTSKEGGHSNTFEIEKISENFVSVEKKVMNISNVSKDSNQIISEICSKDENKNAIEIKTPIFDNYSPLFLDEPPDDDFIQTINSNITIAPTQLDAEFYESTSNKPKATNESKTERNIRYDDIGLFSEIPPDDDEDGNGDGDGFDNFFVSVPSNLEDIAQEVSIQAKNEKAVEKPKSILNNNKSELLEDIAKGNVIPQKQTISKLKIPNININVQALLPGSAVGKSKTNRISTKALDHSHNTISPIEISKTTNQPSMNKEKEIRSEEGRDNLLTSLCKNRVRGPSKRRASTRAGRQERYLKALEIEKKERHDIIVDENREKIKSSDNINQKSSLTHDRSFMPEQWAILSQPKIASPQAVNHKYTINSSDFLTESANTLDTNDLFSRHINSQRFDESAENDFEILASERISEPSQLQPATKPSHRPNQMIASSSNLFDVFADTTDNDDFFSSLVKAPVLNESSQISRKSNHNSNSSLKSERSNTELPPHPPLETTQLLSEKESNFQKIAPEKLINIFTETGTIDDDDDIFRRNVNVSKEGGQSESKNVAAASDSDDDLFQSNNVPMNKTSRKAIGAKSLKNSTSLFDNDTNEDDDDDLFHASTKSKLPSQLASHNSKTTATTKSLFSDSEDDDDLFGATKPKRKTTATLSVLPSVNLNSQTPKDTRIKTTAPTTADNPLADLLNS